MAGGKRGVMSDSPRAPWWDKGRHEDRRPFLLMRGRIKRAIRAWFEGQGFVEVETAALQVSPGNETHLHAFATEFTGLDGQHVPFYLHTSPEFACKKLLAAGEKRIFTFAPCFRNRELGALHEPEFTMLEWYRAGEDYAALMDDCSAILRLAADATGRDTWAFRGRRANVLEQPERVSVAEAVRCTAGFDLLATVTDRGVERERLAVAARTAGVRVAEDDTWSDIFTRILVERVEPMLGDGRAAFLDRYPVSEAALARVALDDWRVADRFELFCCGVELANGFGELTDAVEQRNRFKADMAEKERIYGEGYPIDDDFLAAVAAMPAASGCALGFDRLVMLAAGAERLDQVIWTPVSATIAGAKR
jgi:elongation factor P--(R)-beta-lysine ligase